MASRLLNGGFMNRTGLFIVMLAGLMALGVISTASAQDADECLDCHDDMELTKNVGDRVVSLHVDIGQFNASIHGQQGIECIDCHEDLDGFDDWPHDEELTDVDCTTCHDDVAEIYAESMHGLKAAEGDPLAPQCWSCHGAHDITPAEDPDSAVNKFNIPIMCGRCHKEGAPVGDFANTSQDSVLTHYSLSIHGEGLYRRGLTGTAVCSDCHTAHNVRNHNDPLSTIHKDNVSNTCRQCHGLIEIVHQKVIEGELWEKDPTKVPVCIECHQPHEVRRVYYDQGMSNQECMVCHENPALTATGLGREGESMFVNHGTLLGSVHKKQACIQCHTGATPDHERPCDTVPSKVDCAICHAEVVDIYKSSIHGKLGSQGDTDSPDCLVCHGSHDVLPRDDMNSRTYVRNIPDLCGSCHDKGGQADKRYEGTQGSMVANYRASVHGRALEKSGLVVTAT